MTPKEQLINKISSIVELRLHEEQEISKCLDEFIAANSLKEKELKSNILTIFEKGTRQRMYFKDWEKKIVDLCKG